MSISYIHTHRHTLYSKLNIRSLQLLSKLELFSKRLLRGAKNSSVSIIRINTVLFMVHWSGQNCEGSMLFILYLRDVLFPGFLV
jgi:hypothetical protein